MVKSTLLAIVATMCVSALYSIQNLGDIKVRFMLFEWNLPQGIWEIALFCAGAVLMWLFAFFGSFETKGKYKRQIKELNDKLRLLQEDKDKLLASLASRPVEKADGSTDSSGVASCDAQKTAEHKEP